MHGSLVPQGIDWANGLWNKVNNNPIVIHFIHRWWAWVVVIFLVILARKIRQQSRKASIAINIAFGIQIVLGITTVMTQVHLHVAVMHQAVGALVVIATAWGVHLLGRERL